MTFQIVVAATLVVSGGLALRSFYRQALVDLGFDPAPVLAVEMQAGRRYSLAGRQALVDELSNAGRQIPGVASVALSDEPPLSDTGSRRIQIPDGMAEWVTTRFVTPQYFGVLSIPPTQGGRDPASFLRRGAAVVNEAFARRLLRGNPLGQRIGWADEQLQVTGVVGAAREQGAREEPGPVLYRPLADAAAPSSNLYLLVRARENPAAVAPAVRALIRRLDPDLPFSVTTLDAKFAASRADTRFVAVAFGLSSAVALLLAAVGVFAQVRHAVALRAYEMAIRSAIGGTPRIVVRELLAPLLVKGAVALAVGLALGSMVGRTMGAVLYGVLPTDAVTLAAGALVIVVTVALACAGPARRAALAGPLGALRRE